MGSVRLDPNGFILDGKRQVLLVGSLFYFRLPRASWRDRMEKMKAAGYHALDVYFPWNHHELARDVWDFFGERDVDAFLNLAQEVGLYVVARPGPYICSEWDGGGLPAYLFPSAMRVRDNDPAYLQRVQLWFDRILPLLRDHSHSRNGCVIAMQLENELDFYAESRDRHGYIRALQQMALAAGIDVP
ncbi:MAG TPA: beta-galactosidase, partial [Clostridia bacterium]|nr:beta-galactosidase [Clostridia bacterium]